MGNIDLSVLDRHFETMMHTWQKRQPSNRHPLYITEEEIATLLDIQSYRQMYHAYLPAIEKAAVSFHLTLPDIYALLIILTPRILPEFKRIYAYFHDDLNQQYPTFSLIADLLARNEHERMKLLTHFSNDSGLQTFCLVRALRREENPQLLNTPLEIEDSVADYLFGHYRLERALSESCRLLTHTGKTTPSRKTQELAQNIRRAAHPASSTLLHLLGRSNSAKLRAAHDLAGSFGFSLLRVHTPLALETFEKFGNLLDILQREAILSQSCLYFDHFDAFLEHPRYAILEFLLFGRLARLPGLIFFASKHAWHPKHLPEKTLFLDLAFPLPDSAQAKNLWETTLQEVDADFGKQMSSRLAEVFRLEEEQIAQISQRLKAQQVLGRTLDEQTLFATCRATLPFNLEHLAQPVKTAVTMEEIILPEVQTAQLYTIIAHYRYQHEIFEAWGFKKHFQSEGMSILFTGPPGTGKTMAASILANTMGLELLRVDLSQVVSKYIGETEKNLSRIFDATEGNGVMLFFDEADAIFGKRTEVKDAHDRYANVETGYLLQRIETYGGPVVLASNFRKNIDEAFLRRLRFIVAFPFPDAADRQRIWEKILPAQTPREEALDFALLAKRFKLSGAGIRNAALFAAFYAAEAKSGVSMRYLLQGIQDEWKKSGKTFKDSDFDLDHHIP